MYRSTKIKISYMHLWPTHACILREIKQRKVKYVILMNKQIHKEVNT